MQVARIRLGKLPALYTPKSPRIKFECRQWNAAMRFKFFFAEGFVQVYFCYVSSSIDANKRKTSFYGVKNVRCHTFYIVCRDPTHIPPNIAAAKFMEKFHYTYNGVGPYRLASRTARIVFAPAWTPAWDPLLGALKVYILYIIHSTALFFMLFSIPYSYAYSI